MTFLKRPAEESEVDINITGPLLMSLGIQIPLNDRFVLPKRWVGGDS